MKKWHELPRELQNNEVRYYYDILVKKKYSIWAKRCFDFILSGILFIVLLPIFAIISFWIKLDSKGSVIYRQVRITTYGRKFKIFKFRTMVDNADIIGTQVTTDGDSRITRCGTYLRKLRLDELPQLVNVLKGEMSFVGTRPEVEKYTRHYTDKMKATFLMPAGITSRASIEYKDEAFLIKEAVDADEVYIHQILPGKMQYNLREIEKFSFGRDLLTMIKTVIAVIK